MIQCIKSLFSRRKKPTYTFEIYKSRRSKLFYWRLRASNGEIMCISEGMHNKKDCKSAIRSIYAHPYRIKYIKTI